MKRLLFCWPAAEFSTFDLATGMHAALVAQGVELEDYRHYQRFRLISSALSHWAPEGHVPDIALCALHASEPLPYKALTTGCDWALIVSGMGYHPNALWALRQIGVRIAVWFSESPYETDNDRELHLARLADVAFVNERTAVGAFQAVLDEAGNGGRAVYLRHAFNPAVHHPGESDPERQCDVVFVGTGFTERVRLLEAIDWTGIDFRFGGMFPGVRSPSFLAQHLRYPCLDNDNVVGIYRSAKIVLNPHRYSATAESTNPRTYEAAACGTFQIADYRAEIEDLFGESVPLYRPSVPWQLSVLIRRYLADESERNRLAELARQRVQGETFAVRAATVVQTLAEHETATPRLRAIA